MTDDRVTQSIREIEFLRSELIKAGETVKERDQTLKELNIEVSKYAYEADRAKSDRDTAEKKAEELRERIEKGTNNAVDRSIEHEAKVKELREERDRSKKTETETLIENQRMKLTIEELREALKTCIGELMYESTTGHWWMWARNNEAVSEKLTEIRKMIYP